MELVLALLVLAAAIALLAYPLYRAQTQNFAFDAASTLDDLLAERDGVYATLRDLDTDKQLGKLDDADYTALREKYLARATALLQQLDTLRGEGEAQDASAEIERQVAALRRRTTDDERRTKPNETSNVKRETSGLRCANCGRPHKAGDQFCARCGRALS